LANSSPHTDAFNDASLPFGAASEIRVKIAWAALSSVSAIVGLLAVEKMLKWTKISFVMELKQ